MIVKTFNKGTITNVKAVFIAGAGKQLLVVKNDRSKEVLLTKNVSYISDKDESLNMCDFLH